MTETIRQVHLVGLLDGIPDVTPKEMTAALLTGMFEYSGFEYFVRPTGRYGVWQVIKCASDGQALAEYEVRLERKTVTCDCFSARRGQACRHKEMVRMFVAGRDEGTCGEPPKQSKMKQKQRRAVIVPPTDDTSGTLSREQMDSVMKSLADVNALLEKARAVR